MIAIIQMIAIYSGLAALFIGSSVFYYCNRSAPSLLLFLGSFCWFLGRLFQIIFPSIADSGGPYFFSDLSLSSSLIYLIQNLFVGFAITLIGFAVLWLGIKSYNEKA